MYTVYCNLNSCSKALRENRGLRRGGHGGLMVIMFASYLQGWGFRFLPLLCICGVCMLSLCLSNFSLGTPVFSPQSNDKCRLIDICKLFMMYRCVIVIQYVLHFQDAFPSCKQCLFELAQVTFRSEKRLFSIPLCKYLCLVFKNQR